MTEHTQNWNCRNSQKLAKIERALVIIGIFRLFVTALLLRDFEPRAAKHVSTAAKNIEAHNQRSVFCH